MFTHAHHTPADWLWVLSTDFGILVFSLTFITWTLIIINLALTTVFLVHIIFGRRGILRARK